MALRGLKVHVVSDVRYCAGKSELTDFWSSIEPADQVGRDLVLGSIGSGTKIAQFEYGLLFIHLDRNNGKPGNQITRGWGTLPRYCQA